MYFQFAKKQVALEVTSPVSCSAPTCVGSALLPLHPKTVGKSGRSGAIAATVSHRSTHYCKIFSAWQSHLPDVKRTSSIARRLAVADAIASQLMGYLSQSDDLVSVRLHFLGKMGY
jgi:hypothetical protein